ncbi:MAG: hypothetical protein HYW01_00680 [Deltaproteobacteria bacterium]|nr:hypothetical protein [Deltaproteobacteria bacterium]
MKKLKKEIKKQDGIALLLALIMLLVLTTLAITISFTSNIDFQTMSSYKRGQEAFLAAERCVEEGRMRFEIVGIETLYFLLQSAVPTNELVVKWPKNDPPTGARCRTGSRYFNRVSADDPPPFIEIPPPTKTLGRPIKHVSLPSGGAGGAALVPSSFLVTGKDANDEDLTDQKTDINTGTEIAVGFETFIPGGASNVY